MTIAVLGLWHLGCVTAACLAEAGFQVLGFDRDRDLVAHLDQAEPPIAEPGLEDLLRKGLDSGRLRFSDALAEAARADLVWICYDTPVDQDDQADTESVLAEAEAVFSLMPEGAIMVLSSQLPLGSAWELERRFAARHPGRNLSVACVPENLRLGKALEIFRHPDRIVAGVRDEAARLKLGEVLGRFTDNIIWMSVESAEMVKHALNAFLALSVTYINELAGLCERFGANGFEVESGLKSDVRIGPRAYLHPGPAFAGGTLARDVSYLVRMGQGADLPLPLISSIAESNSQHAGWPRRRLGEVFGNLTGVRVTVLGLTYKPGTDTLRRSEAVTTCRWLVSHGAEVRVYDPAVPIPRPELPPEISITNDPVKALAQAQAVLIYTGWEEIMSLEPEVFATAMDTPLVLDPGRLLPRLAQDKRIRYLTVGIGA
jgi:UDPglucose 6-dehydrogenase